MLLRFVAENFLSFKSATEFNCFPSSKSQQHENHKISCRKDITALRLSAIYGANGAGKSNLIKAISLLKELIIAGNFKDFSFSELLSFQLDPIYPTKPSGFAIEFCWKEQIYYYHLEFYQNEVVAEELFLTGKNKDEQIFSRINGEITVEATFIKKADRVAFLDILNRMVRKDMILLSFFGQNYPKEMSDVATAYDWINTLTVILPGQAPNLLPHYFKSERNFSTFVNSLIPGLNTGIHKLDVREVIVDENDIHLKEMSAQVEQAKKNPGLPVAIHITGTYANLVFEKEKNQLIMQILNPYHKDKTGSEKEMPFLLESDGSRRMIEFMPFFYSILNYDSVYIVDEIERSIHPILIKNIMQMLSDSTTAKGQLIFSTHESALLDQSIFRPDEIWFAQKDAEQATQLYPLSDYNIHRTANIENGYLNGRYGGIPFLSNLKDLHW